MDIIVCIKQIIDPEMPPAKFKIDTAARKVIPPEGIPLVVSPFDEQAVEAALLIKDKQNARITVMTMGHDPAREAMKRALSMGVDEGIMLSDAAFDDSDAFSTAYVLSKAMDKIGQYDLILCGRQAADWDAGQVGSVLAEYLGLPVITLAKKIEVVGGSLRVERVIPDGYEVVGLPLPAVVTVSSEIGQARLPTGRGIIMAARKPIPVWKATDIGCDPSRLGGGAARSELLSLFIPAQNRRQEVIIGADAAEAASNLAVKLKEEKVI